MRVKYFFIAICLLISTEIYSKPIIILLTHPRSLSTAFERIMRERGDCYVMHEPFTYLYYLKHFPEDEDTEAFPDYFPDSYEGLVQFLQEKSKEQTVFVKDMAFAAKEYLLNKQFLGELKEVYFVFLKRDPIKALPSLYAIQPVCEETFIGYKDLFELYEHLPKQFLFDADELENDPQRIYKNFCNQLNLSYDPKHLSFHKQPPEDWQGQWYDQVISSKAIKKSDKAYPKDPEGTPLFKEIPLNDRQLWLDYYFDSKNYYDKIN